MNILPALLAITFSVLSGSVLAQGNTIYRCGPDGRELSQTPCPGGQVLSPKVSEPDAQQRREASEAAQREAALGKKMESERLQREATQQAQTGAAAGIHGRGQAAAAAPAASAAGQGKQHKKAKSTHKPTSKPEGFTSTSPKPAKAPKPPKGKAPEGA